MNLRYDIVKEIKCVLVANRSCWSDIFAYTHTKDGVSSEMSKMN